LKFLPEHVAAVLPDDAARTGLSETQVVEWAITRFLDLAAPTFANLDSSQLQADAKREARLEYLEETWSATTESKLDSASHHSACRIGLVSV
jgi:hypothetical protein